MLFKDAGFKCYLQYRKYRAFDDELIEQFPEEWWDGSQPTVLYIHLIGSHMPFSQRHPADFAPFSGREDRYTAGMKPELAELLNEYDNSIAFTDRVVAACIERLRALKRPAFLLYFSDHGEAVAPGNGTVWPSATTGWRPATRSRSCSGSPRSTGRPGRNSRLTPAGRPVHRTRPTG